MPGRGGGLHLEEFTPQNHNSPGPALLLGDIGRAVAGVISLHAESVKEGVNIFLDVLGFLQKENGSPRLMSLHKRGDVPFASNIGNTKTPGPFTGVPQSVLKVSPMAKHQLDDDKDMKVSMQEVLLFGGSSDCSLLTQGPHGPKTLGSPSPQRDPSLTQSLVACTIF
jgi:hypothetical protein